MSVDGAVFQRLDRGERGRDADRVPVVRPREHDPSSGRERVHVGRAADERGDREAVGHRLGERREVGRDPGDALVPAQVVSEAGDDLVEDEQGAVVSGQAPQLREVAGLGRHAPDVVGDDLDEDRGDALGMRSQGVLHRLRVVPGQDHRLVEDLGSMPDESGSWRPIRLRPAR